MARYFFDIRDGQEFLDTTGRDLVDGAAARREAVQVTGEILREMPERLLDGVRWTMTVRDAFEREIFVVEVETSQFGLAPGG